MNLNNFAEVELSYKRNYSNEQRPTIKDSKEAFRIFYNLWDENKLELLEQAKILLLDRSLRVLGVSDISTGGVTGTVVDPKIVFVTALKANATAIVLAHNHPSGSLKPSRFDRLLTDRVTEIGKLLEIELADHLIISNEGYYSFSDGLAFEKVQSEQGYELECLMPF